jgi:dienelactone hydrolase
MRSILTYLVLAVSITACEPDFLDGIDRKTLFAPPTTAEVGRVADAWYVKPLNPTEYNIDQEVELTTDGTKLKMISYKVGTFKQYAALITHESSEPLPLRMYIGGFDLNNPVNGITLKFKEGRSGEPFVFAMPALRGQALNITVNDVNYTTPISDGAHCDAFEGATDDAIALLKLIENTGQGVDMNRIAVRGGSRGATVALLVAAREPRVKFAIGIAGPTDLLGLTAQSENDATYQCQFLDELKNGTVTLNEARNKMISSSPIYFIQRLPKIQLHMGIHDKIVPVSEGQKFADAMTEFGRGQLIEFYTYDRGHEDIATDNTVLNARIEELLSDL